jgi:hypothetical protein
LVNFPGHNSRPRWLPAPLCGKKWEVKNLVPGFALLLAVSLSPIASAQTKTDPALREPGVFYLEGNVPGKVTAAIKAPTTLYLRRDFQTPLAVLEPGQTAEIIGTGPEGYLIKGSARNNTVVGWIHPEDLPTGFNPDVFVEAKKTQARRDAVSVAISNKNVIPGMTPDEVTQAVGKPEQVASRLDATGSSLTWIFTTYREEPQYTYAIDAFGHPVMQTYYVKIPIGQMIVAFANGAVASVEQHTTDPNSPGVVTN